MSILAARNKLIHALLWLRSEKNAPAWTMPGVYFALREIEKAKGTFYCNSSHRSRQCLRCSEIVAVAELTNDGKAVA